MTPHRRRQRISTAISGEFRQALHPRRQADRAVCGRLEWLGTLRHSLSVSERGGFVMAEENKSYGLAWFLAGLGVGALVGILYAPKSGKETREDIANGAREGTEYLRARTREAAENVSAMVDKGKEHVSAFVDKSKEQVGEYVDRGRDAIDRGRAQWEEFVERGKNLVADQIHPRKCGRGCGPPGVQVSHQRARNARVLRAGRFLVRSGPASVFIISSGAARESSRNRLLRRLRIHAAVFPGERASAV